MRRIRPSALLIAGGVIAALHCDCVRAEVSVQGEARDVRVEARDATVAEILAALGERFAVRYHGTAGSGAVNGTFEGPLRRVVARVIEGYNYVIQARGNGLDVYVLSTQSRYAVPAPVSAPPTVPSRRQREN